VLPVLFAGDPKQLPAMYQKVAISLDSEMVLAAHKAQEPLPEGVSVGERGQHLRWI